MKNKMTQKRQAMIEPTDKQAKAAEAVLATEPEPDSPALGRAAGGDVTQVGPRLSLDIDCRHGDWHGLEAALAAQADFVWRYLDLPHAEVSLVLADSRFIATLNETYRDKKGATNVLSFPAQDFTAPVSAGALNDVPLPRLLGDIVLAHDVLCEEAKAQGKTLHDHMHHLLTHGLLHLLGHDHMQEADAQLMEELEKNILAAQGRPDPYRSGRDEKAAGR